MTDEKRGGAFRAPPPHRPCLPATTQSPQHRHRRGDRRRRGGE